MEPLALSSDAAEAYAKELAVIRPHERDMLLLLVKGYTQREVAPMVNRTHATVANRMMSIKRRTGLTLIELAVAMAKANWV